MINYPNGRKATAATSHTTTWSRRGMKLEDDINSTNAHYLSKGRAVIYKKPTPIQIVTVDYKSRETAKITEAYFRTPSTTDYNGVYDGLPVDFEAKETKSKTSFVLKLIHPHQLTHLENVIDQKAVAFILVRFSELNVTFYVKAVDIIREVRSLKKSLPFEWFIKYGHEVPCNLMAPVDYLEVVDQLRAKGDLL